MFNDADIARHLRSIGLKGGSQTANYREIGIPSDEDRTVGKVPHMAGLKLKNQETFELREQHEMKNGSLMKPLHWARLSEVKD